MRFPSGVIKRGKSSNWRFPAGETHGMGRFPLGKWGSKPLDGLGYPHDQWLRVSGGCGLVEFQDFSIKRTIFSRISIDYLIIPPFRKKPPQIKVYSTEPKISIDFRKKNGKPTNTSLGFHRKKHGSDHPSWQWQQIQILQWAHALDKV